MIMDICMFNILCSYPFLYSFIGINGNKRTGLFGKITNDQANYWCNRVNEEPFLDGFSRISVPCAQLFYETQFFEKYINGTYYLREYEQSSANYLTSIEGNSSVNWLEYILTDNELKTKPFMMWLGPHAPHSPSIPPEWYAHEYLNLTAPQTPNFNVEAVDKVEWMRNNTELIPSVIEYMNQAYIDRVQTLMSVDDMVEAIVDTLQKYNVLDNTYIIFTSDHGYHLGQFRVAQTKHLPYDYDLRVPFFIRGPHINPLTKSSKLVSNIDILPTILDIANIKYDINAYDGISMKNILFGETVNNWRNEFISQYISIGTKTINDVTSFCLSTNGTYDPNSQTHPPKCDNNGNPYYMDYNLTDNWRVIRILNESMNVMYLEWIELPWNNNSFNNPIHKEFYNISIDYWQMNNIYSDINSELQIELHNMVMKYGNCQGTSCW